ncbi:hypothetical protein, partial [Streptomyces sp. AS02]|uniref:hypothetical protein n=1 Tax=Streptomyces sp. AS02 TaxID=2938946 RepID=UPI0020223C7B
PVLIRGHLRGGHHRPDPDRERRGVHHTVVPEVEEQPVGTVAVTAQLPVGVVTAVVGGVYLGLLLRRQRREGRI